MPTPSSRLGLLIPGRNDPFVTGDVAANWGKLDAYPGIYVCTSTTRPSWGNAQAGMSISETDTGLVWRWTGTQWVRAAAKGHLGHASRTTDFSTTSGTLVVALATPQITVPAGSRALAITLNYNRAQNDGYGELVVAICRSNQNNVGPILESWVVPGDVNASTQGAKGGGTTLTAFEWSGVPAGAYYWSIQIRSRATVSNPGTSYLLGGCDITVCEQ